MHDPIPHDRLQKLMEMSEDLFLIANLDGQFLHLNPAREWNLGHSREHLASTPLVDFLHPEDVEPTMEELRSLAEGERTSQFANRFRHSDGHWVWLRWNAAPDIDEGLIYAIARDISDFTQAREDMQEYVNALRSGSALVQASRNHAEVLTQQLRE